MEKIIVPQTINHLEGITFRRGTLKKEFIIDGNRRVFTYYIPTTLKKNGSIIVLAHGSYCNGDIMRASTAYGFEEAAEKNNSIIVYPNSYGPYWNDGRLGRMHIARELEIDEIKFFKKIIDYIKRVYGGSDEKIYFGGFSNGGALGFKLSSSGLFKKVAYWCINLPNKENRDYHIEEELPPSIFINNIEDGMVPFDGGDLLGADGQSRGSFYSTYDTFLKYSREVKLPIANSERYYNRYLLGDNILIEVFKGGHTIPHPQTVWPAVLGVGNKFNSIDLVWKFFEIE